MSNAFMPLLRRKLMSPYDSESSDLAPWSVDSSLDSAPVDSSPVSSPDAYRPTLMHPGETPSQPASSAFNPSNQYMQDLQGVSGKLMQAYQAPQPGMARQVIGALFSRHNPQLGALISGQAQRERQIEPLQQEYGLLANELNSARAMQTSDLQRQNIQSEIEARKKLADFRENPIPKTPDEQAMSNLQEQTNPETGKLYTPFEARVKLAQSISDIKPATAPPTKTLMIGGKAHAMGWNPKTKAFDIDEGEVPPSFAQTGLYDPIEIPDKNGGMTPAKFDKRTGNVIPISPGSNVPIPKEAQKEIDKELSDARGADNRFKTMSQNEKDALGGNQQAMLSLVANHIGMTLGAQKGARINQAVWNEAIASTPWLQGIQAKFDNRGYLSGVTLTPEQIHQMVDLARQKREIQWHQAKQAARQYGVDNAVKLPSDVQDEAIQGNPSAGQVPTFGQWKAKQQ